MATMELSGSSLSLLYNAVEVAQTPEEAYSAWANEIGVSATETLAALNGDDIGWPITLAEPFFDGGTATAMFSAEGGIGLYFQPPTSTNSTGYTIANISRMHGLGSRPNVLLSFHPPSDLKSFDAKLQRSGSTTIIFSRHSRYSDESQYVYHSAIRIRPQTIELIGRAVTNQTNLYWTQLQAVSTATVVLQQSLIAAQAVGTSVSVTAQVLELPVAESVAPGVLANPAVWAYSGDLTYQSYAAAPTPLSAPVAEAIVSPAGYASDSTVLGAPDVRAFAVATARGAAPSSLAGPFVSAKAEVASVSSAPSSLTAAAVGAFHDFSGLIGDVVTQYSMDLVTTSGAVRAPISTWQATLQVGRANYVQCVIPACEDYVSAINAATEFVIYRQARSPSGAVIEQVMARSPVELANFSRGPLRFTCVLSGYTDGFSGDESAVPTRSLAGVRSDAWGGSGRRVRCDVDWFLRPGVVARMPSGETFIASYINYYVGGGDAYMDVGERV